MMLRLTNVRKSFVGPSGRVVALDAFSLHIQSGEAVAVQGPSGSGKTTLLLIAGGMLRPDAGDVTLGGLDLYSLPGAARARQRAQNIGFVFQQFHLTPYLNVIENVLSAAVHADRQATAEQLLRRFGLAQRMLHRPGQLSSGERQRAALARALVNHPRLVLADEPTGNLDRENGDIVLKHLMEYVQEGGALLLVTHDPEAAKKAQRLIVLGQ